MKDITFNGKEIFTVVYCVLWDEFDPQIIFRSERDAEEYIENKCEAYRDYYSIRKMEVY